MAQIARHLDVDLEVFISMPSVKTVLTRANKRQKFAVSGSSIIYERLAADFAGSVLSSFILTIPPGYRAETVSHEGEELLFILERSITDRLDDEEMILSAGDSLHFRGNRPHSWSNHTSAPARVLWTGTLPVSRSRLGRPVGLELAGEISPLENGKKELGKIGPGGPKTSINPGRRR